MPFYKPQRRGGAEKKIILNTLRLCVSAVEKAIFFACMLPLFCHSQDVLPNSFEDNIEQLSENSTSTPDFSDLSDEHYSLLEHPVNLNNTTAIELKKIPFLNDRQINNLMGYIQTYGDFVSIFELQAIEGFDSATIQKILPYVTVSPGPDKHPVHAKDLVKYGRNQLFLRYQQVLQKQKGYNVPDSILRKNPNDGYLGSPQSYYFRYSYTYYNRISIGLCGAKSAGEEFFKGSEPYGMDYYSGYLCLHKIGFIKTLILGNFQVDYGQGLTLSSGLSFGSLPGSGNSKRYAGGIRPSLAVNGNSYLQGGAITFILLKKLEFSAFYSNHKRDGNINTTDTLSGQVMEVSSVTATGYHRLPKELEDKNSVRENIYGGNVNFRNDFMSIGVTAFKSRWSARLSPKIHPYNQFAFAGKENFNAGMDFQFLYRNVYFFGEFSESQNTGIAYLGGFLANPDPAVTFSVIYRDYQRNYQDLLSNAIGQNSVKGNEKGFLVNVSTRLIPGLGISAYADLFAFPWLKYGTDFISQGTEYKLQADFSIRKTLMYLRFRQKTKQVNSSQCAGPIAGSSNNKCTTVRYQVEWPVNSTIQMNNRFEVLENQVEGNGIHYGYLISQGIFYKPTGLPLAANFLFALFDTYSYNERIYSYENDVLYGYSVPAYEGKGIRCYLLINWSPLRKLEIWFRYAQTFYTDRNTIGTGLEQINGDMKSEIKLQIRFRM
jgi:hypothetical protein